MVRWSVVTIFLAGQVIMIQSSETSQRPKDLTDSSGISTSKPHQSSELEIFTAKTPD